MSLDDFYELKRLQDGLDVITMDVFLREEATVEGRLKETWSGG